MNTKSSKCPTLNRWLSLILVMVAAASSAAAQSPRITQSGDVVALQNESVRLEFDLARGTYSIFKQNDRHPTLSKARLRINEWSSDGTGVEQTWTQRAGQDSSGQGLALDPSFKSKAAPELLISFVLHEGRNFLSASGGCFNSGNEPVRIKSIRALADGVVYEGVDLTRDFAPVGGFSGGPKGIMPGVAHLNTVMNNHGVRKIGDANAGFGVTEGNPIWEEMRDIALRAGPRCEGPERRSPNSQAGRDTDSGGRIPGRCACGQSPGQVAAQHLQPGRGVGAIEHAWL